MAGWIRSRLAVRSALTMRTAWWIVCLLTTTASSPLFAQDAPPPASQAETSAPVVEESTGQSIEESPAPLSEESPEISPPADPEEKLIRELVLKLEDRDGGTEAVSQLVALRDARVLPVFAHIQERTLYHWNDQIVHVPSFAADESGVQVGQVYDLFTTQDTDGMLSSEPLATVTKAELAEFKEDRRARRAVLDALTVIGLIVDDPVIRATAANDLGNKRQIDALPKLRELAESDPDPHVRHVANESVQLIIAGGADSASSPEDRIAAVAQLGRLKSIRAMDFLKSLREEQGWSEPDLKIIDDALSRIQRHLSITNWIKNMFFGLSAGSILVVLALGLAITFGLMGVINMAHGEMLMIGAVTTWACYEYIGTALPPEWFNWYYVIALPASFLVAAFVGLLTEVLIVRHLYKRPLDSLLATIGVSFVLIQAVRLWKGDNLGMRRPSWFTGGFEIMQDVVLPYNRLFIIALTIMCVVAVMMLFRYTRIGLMIRATVQNREMAEALGVNTRFVDMFTFALGAGLAGIAGYAIFLISNPTPDMGQGYIVKSFLVVVVGGVGKLIGVIVSGLALGFTEKILEPITIITKPLRIFDATWAQVAVLILVVLFIQRRPSGLFPDKGRMADQADRNAAPWQTRPSVRTDVILGVILAVLGLVVVPALYLNGTFSLEYVNKLGYITSFAIAAVGLDLIWGYVGVLSLCQFLFFSLGGYCMGLYLINHGPKDIDGIPMCLSYVMSAVTNRTPPWFLPIFDAFPMAVLLGVLLPGVLALLIGMTTFRSRVRGVYFAILTQAVTVGGWLVFQKNDLKLGGTNGLTKFDSILGFHIAADSSVGPLEQTRFWLYVVSVAMLLLLVILAKLLVRSQFGRTLIAIRDDETRLRFIGYQTWIYNTAVFTLAAVFAGIGGMLYVPQKGIITPHQISAVSSILVVVWVAVGGRGTLWGAVVGAFAVNLLYDMLTSRVPEAWPFALGALFIFVPLLLPGGVMSLWHVIRSGSIRATPARLLQARAPAKVTEGGPA